MKYYLPLLLALLYVKADAQKLYIGKNIPANISDAFKERENELKDRLASLACDSIIVWANGNDIVIEVSCEFQLDQLKTLGRTFDMTLPNQILTNVALVKSVVYARTKNVYLEDVQYSITLKNANNRIAFYYFSKGGFYGITFLHQKKYYDARPAAKSPIMFLIDEPFNLDGSKTSNFYLCELLRIKI
jgi:hypothetical protein